jgi:putative selenium metabolism hydrolase
MGDLYPAIRTRAKHLEGETTRLLADMIRVRSFSTKEMDVANLIRREMEHVGFDDVRIDALGNVIGRIGSGPRTIAFDAHVDTVYPGDPKLWDDDPFSGKIEGGRVWGRGAVDQKGGMASMVYAGQIVKELALSDGLTIYFTGTVMEEDCEGLCWSHLIEEEGIRPELVVITEPTNLNIHRGHRGRVEIGVRLGGVSCHGSAPERGENAIYKMARVVPEIESLNARLEEKPFLGKGTVTVTEIRSSSPSLCAVPDGARIHLDRRLTSGETGESAVAEVRDAAARAGYPEADVRILEYDAVSYTGRRCTIEKDYPTWVLDEGSPLLAVASESYEGVFGRKPRVDKWTFSTNGVTIAGRYGIPCLGLGPGDETLAHAPNEACPVDHLGDAAAFYAAFVAHLNGKC